MTKYKAIATGLKEIGRSARVQQECLRAAERLAAQANSDDPRGRYVAQTANVPSGWDLELRAGARVKETARGLGGMRKTLRRLTR